MSVSPVEPIEPIEPDVLDTPAAGRLIIRGGALRFASYLAVVALSVIPVAILTRYLGVVRFGQYATIISLVTVVSVVTDAGMSGLGTREWAVRKGADRDTLMRDLLGLRIALTLAGVVFAIAVAGVFLNRKNVILLLMCVELLLLAANFNFIAFSRYLGDIRGQVFVFFVLTVAAAESAIGLAILVVLFRERRSINVEDLNTLKG